MSNDPRLDAETEQWWDLAQSEVRSFGWFRPEGKELLLLSRAESIDSTPTALICECGLLHWRALNLGPRPRRAVVELVGRLTPNRVHYEERDVIKTHSPDSFSIQITVRPFLPSDKVAKPRDHSVKIDAISTGEAILTTVHPLGEWDSLFRVRMTSPPADSDATSVLGAEAPTESTNDAFASQPRPAAQISARSDKIWNVAEVRGKIDVAIITIRQDEYNSVAAELSETEAVEGGNNSYERAVVNTSLGGIVTAALTRCVLQGNATSQAVANNIVHDLDPSWIFLVGIAGGVPDYEYCLGDVIIASALSDFSVAAAIDGRKIYNLSGGRMHPEVDRFLQTKILGRNRDRLYDLAGFKSDTRFLIHPSVIPAHLDESNAYYGSEPFREDVKRKLQRTFPHGRRKRGPEIWSGPCANGNILLKDAALLETWQLSARQIVDIETELVGVYEAARSAGRQNYPVLAIRGLSDIVGLKRDPAWTQYACDTAAAAASAVLKAGLIDFPKSRSA